MDGDDGCLAAPGAATLAACAVGRNVQRNGFGLDACPLYWPPTKASIARFLAIVPDIMLHRSLLLILVPLLLSACGDADSPAPPKAAPGAPAVSLTPVPAPVPSVEQAGVPAKPAAPAVPPLKAAEKPAAASKPAAPALPSKPRKAEAEASVSEPLPPAPLDLRLPKELLHDLKPGKGAPALEEKPLLPPLFAEKPAEESPFQVGGRLIQRDRELRSNEDDSWHSQIQGAELQFHFRN